MGITRTTLAGLCAVLVAALLAGDLSAASPKERLRQKRAEADAVLAQVNALNQSLEASVEGVERRAVRARRHAAASSSSTGAACARRERQRRVAIAHVAARLRALYESGDEDQSTLGILLGSASVSEILDRLDAARAVATPTRD